MVFMWYSFEEPGPPMSLPGRSQSVHTSIVATKKTGNAGGAKGRRKVDARR